MFPRNSFLLCVTLLVSAAAARTALGQTTFSWNNPAGGSYGSVSNWTPIGVPDTAAERALFDLDATYNVTINSGTTEFPLDVTVSDGDVTLAASSSVFASLTTTALLVNGGDLSLDRAGGGGNILLSTGDLTVCDESLMRINQGSRATVGGSLVLGMGNTGGDVLVEGGSTLTLGSGGSHSIGANVLSDSLLTITGPGSTLNVDLNPGVIVGDTGRGVMEVLDGAVVNAEQTDFFIGRNSAFTGRSRLTIDAGSTVDTTDGLGQAGSTRVGESTPSTLVSATLEVLGGSTFFPGQFSAFASSDITIDGAGSKMTVASFVLESSADVVVSNGGVLDLATFSSAAITSVATVIVSEGSTLTGAATIDVAGTSGISPAKIEILSGSTWESSPEAGSTPLEVNLGVGAAAVGELRVDGAGSTFNTGSSGTVRVAAGVDSIAKATFSGGATASMHQLEVGAISGAAGTVIIEESNVTVTGDSELAVSLLQPEGVFERGTADITIASGGSLHMQGRVGVGSGVALNLVNGELRVTNFESIEGNPGAVNWTSGTLRSDDATTLTPLVMQMFLPDSRLKFGQSLQVDDALTLTAPLQIDGGVLTVQELVGAANQLQLNRGTLQLTGTSGLTIGPTGALGSSLSVGAGQVLDVSDTIIIETGSELMMAGGTARNGLGAVQNSGRISGSGTIEGAVVNRSGAEIQAFAGQNLIITGASSSNSGQLTLSGGQLHFQENLINRSGGLIIGNGTLRADGGFSNSGAAAFSATANVIGDVTNSAKGQIISAGGTTTFFDDVVNDGEIRTNANSFTVYFGSYSGNGDTGAGTVIMEGDLKPGSSPGVMSFGGDLDFGPEATLEIEIGGTTPGTQYDRVEVAGVAQIDGTLKVELIDLGSGVYQPQLGDSFGFLASNGGAGGMWHTLNLPELAPGLEWMLNPGGVTVFLNVVAALPGDYNADGLVDAIDYAVWRESLGMTGAGLAADGDGDGMVDSADFDIWRANYGATLSVNASFSTPEPNGLLLALFALLLPLPRQSRRCHPPPS